MKPTMLDLSIIIPTHNRAQMLREAIAAIHRHTRCTYEVIVVDGASNDGIVDVLYDAQWLLGDRLGVIREPRRRGFTKAANEGFRHASGRYVTWLNDDARPLPECYDRAIEQAESAGADVGLLALFHRCKSTRSVAHTAERDGVEFKLMHVRGTLYANFGLGRREVFGGMGYFDERYIARGADPDFSLKVWDAGLRVLPARDCLIDHDEVEDERRIADDPVGRADNDRLFAKWDLPALNPAINEFDPAFPCTLRGPRRVVLEAA